MNRASGMFWTSALLACSLAVTAAQAQSGTTASPEAPDISGLMGNGAMPAGTPAMKPGDFSMAAMPGHEKIAACMGMTVDEFLDYTDPTRGEARSPTKDEMDRHNRVAKKADKKRYQRCMTEAMAQFRIQVRPAQ